MDIVNFWKEQVDKWDAELKCGFCWDFGAPMIESAVNIQQPTYGKECCAKVFFLREKVTAFQTQNTYNTQTGLKNQVLCNKSFQLLVLFDSKLGLNMYNEIKGHDTDESVWTTKLSLLEECLSCDANIDFCEIIGYTSRITNWSAQQVVNYLDSNYVGYRISVTFQEVR